jgi:dimethylargininase
MPIAITRPVSDSLVRCELTHLARTSIDVERARAQHAAYERTLADLGCQIERLPAEHDLPDAVFVEDTAVVLDELALIAHPGAPSRRPEVPSAAEALARYRNLVYVKAPGTFDGGDVLRVGRTIYVGLSQRSNRAAVEQMAALLAPLGYTVLGVAVTGCLHLKSAVTQVAPETLLIQRKWVDAKAFAHQALIDVDPGEPYAANALLIGDAVIYATAYPRTQARLDAHGIDVHTVDVSELAKAEGAVTCCSLILNEGAVGG